MTDMNFTHEGNVFPFTVHHDGKVFWATHKVGHVIKTGVASAEYEANDGSAERLWLDATGAIFED